MSLFREFKIKWWDKFNQALCSDTTVTEFLATGKKLQHHIQQIAKQTDPSTTPKSNSKTPVQLPDDSESEDESRFLNSKNVTHSPKSRCLQEGQLIPQSCRQDL